MSVYMHDFTLIIPRSGMWSTKDKQTNICLQAFKIQIFYFGENGKETLKLKIYKWLLLQIWEDNWHITFSNAL